MDRRTFLAAAGAAAIAPALPAQAEPFVGLGFGRLPDQTVIHLSALKSTMALATGGGGVKDYSITQPFLNIAKTIRSPQVNLNTANQNIDLSDYQDANGYINKKPPSASASMSVDYIWAWNNTGGLDLLYGTYVFTYDGSDPVIVSGGPGFTLVSNVVGRVEFTLDGPSTTYVKFANINPADHPRNFVCVRTDRQAMYGAGEIFNPDYLDGLSNIHTFRFMDWMETNENEHHTFEEYPVEDYLHWHSVPVTIMCALLNRLGCTGWFNVPAVSTYHADLTQVDPTFAVKLATQIKSLLDPNIKVIFEIGNELWNGSFEASRTLRTVVLPTLGWGDASTPYLKVRGVTARLNVLVAQAVKPIFADSPSQFEWAMGTQRSQSTISAELATGDIWKTYAPDEWVDPATVSSTISPAMYFGSTFITAFRGDSRRDDFIAYIDTLEAAYPADDPEIQQKINTYLYNALVAEVELSISEIEATKNAVSAAGFKLQLYEGGSHLWHSFATNVPAADRAKMEKYMIQFSVSSENVDLYNLLLAGWELHGDGPFMQFSDYGYPSSFGVFCIYWFLGHVSPLSTRLNQYSVDTAPWWTR